MAHLNAYREGDDIVVSLSVAIDTRGNLQRNMANVLHITKNLFHRTGGIDIDV